MNNLAMPSGRTTYIEQPSGAMNRLRILRPRTAIYQKDAHRAHAVLELLGATGG